jgi:ATP/maltotriose-dependent transcriptional regulator MalT
VDVLSTYQPQQQLQCLALMVQCSLARGDLDNARSHLNRLENLLGNGQYHSDWVSNADKVRVIYWQMTGDKTRPPTGCARRRNRNSPTTTSCRASGATLPARRSCWVILNRRKWCWKS